MSNMRLDLIQQTLDNVSQEMQQHKKEFDKIAYLREKLFCMREEIDKAMSIIDGEGDSDMVIQHDLIRSLFIRIMKDKDMTEADLARELEVPNSTLLDFMKHYRTRTKVTIDIYKNYIKAKGYKV